MKENCEEEKEYRRVVALKKIHEKNAYDKKIVLQNGFCILVLIACNAVREVTKFFLKIGHRDKALEYLAHLQKKINVLLDDICVNDDLRKILNLDTKGLPQMFQQLLEEAEKWVKKEQAKSSS